MASTDLNVSELHVRFRTRSGLVHAVRGVSYRIGQGEALALVGESGSGKSASALALLRLVPPDARVDGSVEFGGHELTRTSDAVLRQIRGRRVGMVFQDPLSSLNPVLPIATQIGEVLEVHRLARGRAARSRAIELLADVGIPSPAARIDDYPHEFSGGMRQRVMIAMAIACDPELLVADEPTTALDVTAQAEILDLLSRLREKSGMSMLLISHNLGVVARVADRAAVMYAGRIVETANVDDIFYRPDHPYTQGLLASQPRLDSQDGQRLSQIDGLPPDLSKDIVGCPFQPRCPYAIDHCSTEDPSLTPSRRSDHLAACWVKPSSESLDQIERQRSTSRPREESPVLQLDDVRVYYGRAARVPWVRRDVFKAVDGISLRLAHGETLGLVGESGCGKTTVGRAITRLVPITSGDVRLLGQALGSVGAADMRSRRRHLQIVFQDPYSSLDPRARVGDAIREPLDVHGRGTTPERNRRVTELMDLVGLDPALRDRFPHQLSGGQRQRVGIARALALNPDVIICDEPVSSLDVSIQAQIVNLLADLQAQLGLSYLFISHDLAVVRHIAHRVLVMYLGKMVEEGPAADVYRRPLHPYTRALLSAIPIPDPALERSRTRILLHGELPSAANPPSGCRFRTRCAYAKEVCAAIEPEWREIGPNHFAACHFAEEIEASAQRATTEVVERAQPVTTAT